MDWIRHAKRFLLIPTACGVALTALTLSFGWNYCAGGEGRGMPAAVVRPSHGTSIAAIQLQPELKTHGTEISLIAAAIDIGFWSLLSGVVLLARPRGTR